MFDTLKTRLNALVRLGIVTMISAGKTQKLQLKTTKNEVLDDVLHIEPYGFTAHPPKESEAVVLNLNAFADNPIALVVGSRTFRLKDLKEGEVALYTDEGDCLIFKRTNVIEATTKTFKISGNVEIGGNLNISKNVNVIGKADVTGNVICQGDVYDKKGTMEIIRLAFNAHTHKCSAPNSDSAPPTQSM